MRVAIFVALCLALTQAFVPSARIMQEASSVSEDSVNFAINGTLLDLNDYYNGVWAYFNLTQTNAIVCWNDITAENYFQYQQAFYNLAGAFMAGDHANVNIYSAEVVALNATIYEPVQCVQNSQDYQNLMQAAGVNTFNKSLENILQNLYYEGHMGDWYLDWTPVYNLLSNAEYNAAGYLYGAIFQNMSNNGSHVNFYHEALQAFQNGAFFWVNVSMPFELPLCYNESSAYAEMSFLFLWAQMVYNSTVSNVVANTNAFFQGPAQQYTPILQTIWTCEDATQDQTNFNNAVGINVHSQQYQTALGNYIQSNTQTYYNVFSKMYDLFEEFNPLAAGILYGEFVLLVSQSASSIVA